MPNHECRSILQFLTALTGTSHQGVKCSRGAERCPWVGAARPTWRTICVVGGGRGAVKTLWALQAPCSTPGWAVGPCRARLGSAAPLLTEMPRGTGTSTGAWLGRKIPQLQPRNSSCAKRCESDCKGEEKQTFTMKSCSHPSVLRAAHSQC